MGRLLVSAVLALLVAAPVAVAQPSRTDGAVRVVGPTPSGALLFVYHKRDLLCGGPRRRSARGWSEACTAEVGQLRDPLISVDRDRAGPTLVWGFVAPAVATVEIVFAGGSRAIAPTTDGPAYRGRYAGQVRFFMVEAGRDQPLYARLLGSAGVLLAAIDATDGRGAEVRTPRVLSPGRTAGAAWTLRASTNRLLVPLPDDQERIVTRTCVSLTGAARVEFCDDPDLPRRPKYAIERSCSPVGIQILGLVSPDVGRLVAVLGDGSRRRVPLRLLPHRLGPRRAFALVLDPGTALRRLIAVEADRRRVLAGGLGPGLVDCPATTSVYSVDAFALPRDGPGPPALLVRDEETLLCFTIGLPDPRGRDCYRPPLDESQARFDWRSTDAVTFFAGVVPLSVGSVELVFARGERHVVPATLVGPYAGRYRGLIGFVTLALPGRRELRRIALMGTDGQRLLSHPVAGWPSFVRGPRPLLRARGPWRFGAGTVRFPGSARPLPCIQLARGRLSRDFSRCSIGSGQVSVNVSCRPRGTLMFGALKPGQRALRVVTDRGVQAARTASLLPLGLPGRAFLIELPGNATPRVLELRGERTRRLRLRFPAARRQCGYTDSVRLRG